MFNPGAWVTFEGAGQVVEVFDDAYNKAAGTPTKGVIIRVSLSERPLHNFQVIVPLVCVGLAEDRDKHLKAGAK